MGDPYRRVRGVLGLGDWSPEVARATPEIMANRH